MATAPLANLAGRCRFCRCTDVRACEEGCFWINEERNVCSARKCVDAYFGERAGAVRWLITMLQKELMGSNR